MTPLARAYRASLVLLCVAVTAARPCAAQSDSAFVQWAARHATIVDSAGEGFTRLHPVLRSARVVGVGESVHGVEQFMDFRFALLKELVRREQVTALVIESGLPEAMDLNDYVTGRSDTVSWTTAVSSDYGDSKTFRDVVAWLRAWNRGAGRGHPVHLYGADVSIGDGRSMLPALGRLRAIAGNERRINALMDSVNDIAVRAAAPWWGGAIKNYNAFPSETKERLSSLVSRLVSEVSQWRGATVDARAWAVRFATLIQQDEEMLRSGAFSAENPRDAAMADNVKWLATRLPLGERAMVWAHNAHIQRIPIAGTSMTTATLPSMGFRLANSLGAKYLAIGTTYGGASVDSASPPAVGSADALFASVRRPSPFLLVLRGAPANGDIGASLLRERRMRFQSEYLTMSLGAAFDVLAFFDRADPMVKAHDR